ncbi:MAG: DNA-processing protein DprA [Chitinophagaceae bacterium]
MEPVLLYQVALTLVPHIGPVQARILLQHCDPEEIFHAKRSFLEKIEGIGPIRAAAISTFRDFSGAEQEINFIEKHRIQPLFISSKDYPKRLLNCYDSPVLLYYKGEADLNSSRIIAVIGTRNHTEYARQTTEKLIQDLAAQNITVVSGLAFGVDAIAHKSAIRNGLPTIGVLAHGLDQLYPPQHDPLARDMLKNKGGLLTEFRSLSMPDKHNFPSRNRIVAGMCDASIVIETGIKGGSMITAELANGYNRDVFAIPGKISDSKSAGCNHLIRTNKAILLSEAKEIIELLGWEDEPAKTKKKKLQREIFVELGPNEKILVDLLLEKDKMHIDEINSQSGLSNSAVAAAILNLELQNLMLSLPGKLYRLA